MKKAFGDYRLLANGNRRTGRLWQGPDHLLYVETAGFLTEFSESYKRIDYKNIQAITFARTNSGIWITVLYLVFVLLFSWGSYAAFKESSPGLIFFGLLAVISLISLIVHLARGPTCICKLQTAVQFLKLKPLNRVKKAAKFAAEISPLCQGHQGGQTLTPETLAASVNQFTPAEVRIKQPWAGLKLVTWALMLLVLSGILTIADVFIKNMLLFIIDCIVGATAYVLVIAAFVRSIRFEIPAALKSSLWGAVVNLVLSVVTCYGLTIWASIAETQKLINGRTHAFRADGNYTIYKTISDAGFDELGWVAWAIIGIGGLAVFFGLLGLPSALRPGARITDTQKPSAPPPIRGDQP